MKINENEIDDFSDFIDAPSEQSVIVLPLTKKQWFFALKSVFSDFIVEQNDFSDVDNIPHCFCIHLAPKFHILLKSSFRDDNIVLLELRTDLWQSLQVKKIFEFFYFKKSKLISFYSLLMIGLIHN